MANRILTALLCALLMLAGCGTHKTETGSTRESETSAAAKETADTITAESEKPQITETAPDIVTKSAAQKLSDEMSLEQKVGQLFFVRIEWLANENTGVKVLSDSAASALRKYGVGGIVLFKENIDTPEQLSSLTKALQEASGIPLLISADEEGGKVLRVGSNPNFDVAEIPSMEEIGATNDPENAADVGKTLAEYLLRYGINTDFAPVADLSSQRDGGVIGDRSFGNDPEITSDMLTAEITAMRESGLVTCAKHYPGHGATSDDTHNGYAAVYKTWDELCAHELIPFKAAIKADTDMIMAAHISLPNVTKDDLPASLSFELITGKLREELGYDGVVITDALAMGAVKDNYTSGEAAVLAIKAGCDLLLIPDDLDEAYNAVLNAVKTGDIKQERLDESVLRILELKEKHGLLP